VATRRSDDLFARRTILLWGRLATCGGLLTRLPLTPGNLPAPTACLFAACRYAAQVGNSWQPAAGC